jgi:hypothetical protein
MSDLQKSPAQPPRRSWAVRALGLALLFGSVGLVSCQALFSI